MALNRCFVHITNALWLQASDPPPPARNKLVGRQRLSGGNSFYHKSILFAQTRREEASRFGGDRSAFRTLYLFPAKEPSIGLMTNAWLRTAGMCGEEKRLINGAPDTGTPPPPPPPQPLRPAEGGRAETQIKAEEEGRFSRNQTARERERRKRHSLRPSSLFLLFFLFFILSSRRATRKHKHLVLFIHRVPSSSDAPG